MKDLKGIKINDELIVDLDKKVDTSKDISFTGEDGTINFNLGVKLNSGVALAGEGPYVSMYCAKDKYRSVYDVYEDIYAGSGDSNTYINPSSSILVGVDNIAFQLLGNGYDLLVDDPSSEATFLMHKYNDEGNTSVNITADRITLESKLYSFSIREDTGVSIDSHPILTNVTGRTLAFGLNNIPVSVWNSSSNKYDTISDLNDSRYLKIGGYSYYSGTLENSPVNESFIMEVFAPRSNKLDGSDETDRLRVITTYSGEIYIQKCSSSSASSAWKKVGGDSTGTSITVGTSKVTNLTFTSDPQSQINTIASTYMPLTGNRIISGPLTVTGATSLKDTTIDGQLTISGNIYFNGESYITHAEELKVEDDYIILRNGAQTQIQDNSFSGLEFHNYGLSSTGEITSGRLIIDNKGILRVGDIGDEQPLATREETPTDQAVAYWDATTNSFKTDSNVLKSDISKPTKSEKLTLSKSNWSSSSKTQVISITSYDINKLNTIIPELGENGANTLAWANAGVTAIKEDTSGITFQCTSIPTVDLTFYVVSETLQ